MHIYDRRAMVNLFVIFDVFLLAIAATISLFQYVMQDTSYITMIIFGIYFLSNILFYIPRTDFFERMMEWIPTALTGLGLLGTTMGFFVLFNGLFSDASNFQDIEGVKSILVQFTEGISIALLSTISGIGTSLMFNFKRVWLP